MTKVAMKKIFIAFLLVGVSAALLSGQELPILKSNSEDGYVDNSALQSQIDRNTKAIKEISTVLNRSTHLVPIGTTLTCNRGVCITPPPEELGPTGTYYGQPRSVTSNQTLGYEFSIVIGPPNHSVISSAPVIPDPPPVVRRRSDYSRNESVTVQRYSSASQPSDRRVLLANRRLARVLARAPRCQIINGRQSCN